jgi:ATP-binding cassette subfamily F protein uup
VIVAEGSGSWREYIGGYSDWERVRATAAPVAQKVVTKPEAKAESTLSATAPVQSAPKQKKLSYKEQRDLETLPAQIAQWEEEQKAITAKLADAAIYAQPEEVKRLNQRFAEIDRQLLAALERWEEIDSKARG